jgi:hypothetical protein
VIINLREVDTTDGRFWKAETGDFEIYRRNREQAIAVLLTSLGKRLGNHFKEASSLTICVVQRDEHAVSCTKDEGCECGS